MLISWATESLLRSKVRRITGPHEEKVRLLLRSFNAVGGLFRTVWLDLRRIYSVLFVVGRITSHICHSYTGRGQLRPLAS